MLIRSGKPLARAGGGGRGGGIYLHTLATVVTSSRQCTPNFACNVDALLVTTFYLASTLFACAHVVVSMMQVIDRYKSGGYVSEDELNWAFAQLEMRSWRS